jgi:broad specificity phosphatase PhoE
MKYLLFAAGVFFISSCGNTIYIVRHGEKTVAAANMSSDVELSEAGNERALALKEELKGKNIEYIFSTNYKRTTGTAKPLDEYLLSVQTQLYSPHKDSAAAFIQRLKSIKKGNVLVVGHSNTIDDIANMLIGSTVVSGDLKDTDYDNLYEIKRKGNKYVFTGKTYGKPTD